MQNFPPITPGKKYSLCKYRKSEFKTLSNNFDGAFANAVNQFKPLIFFCKKAPPYMFGSLDVCWDSCKGKIQNLEQNLELDFRTEKEQI